MTIPFRCSCGARYDLRDDFAGQVLHCPSCGSAQRVGGEPPAAASVPKIDVSMLEPGSAPPVVLTISSDMLAADVPAAPVEAAPPEHRVDFEKGMSTAPPLTIVLIAANIIIFVITLLKGALESREAIILAGALSREHVLGYAGDGPQPWRLLSAMFLHGGFDHLLGNCLALFVLGMACEHAFGFRRTALLYFLTGLGASVTSIVFSPGPSVGASGAIFGLMGACIVFFRKYRDRFFLRDNRVGVVLMVWAAYSIVTGLMQPFIDNGAHIGGLIFGAGLAWLVRPDILDRIPAPVLRPGS